MDARRGLFADFALATAVLTRLPFATEPVQRGDIAAASWAFPLVGIGVGGIAALVFALANLLGWGGLLGGFAAVFAGIALTGALHEDGLADTVDGWGGGRDRDAKLAIMRDSRHGTYGILALVGSIGVRAACLAALGDPLHAGLALLAAHAGSRAALPAAMHLLPLARADGLGAEAGRPSRVVATIAGVTGTVIALGMLGPVAGAVGCALLALVIAAGGMLARQQIGGYTGDVLGAFQQIGEIVMLLVAAAR